MLYSPKVREQVKTIKVPHDFRMDTIEYNLNPAFIALRYYESQWMHYNDLERLHCITYMQKVINVLTANGIPVTLEPVIDTGESLPDEYKRGYGK